MTMTLIKEGPNGQLEFDFESLEAMTSKEFVEEIREIVGNGEINKCNIKEDDVTVDVLLKYTFERTYGLGLGEMLVRYFFYKKSKRFEQEFMMGTKTLEYYNDWAKGEVQ